MVFKKIIIKHGYSISMFFMAAIQTVIFYYLQGLRIADVISSRENFFLFMATFSLSLLVIKIFLARHEGMEQKAETFIILLLLTIISLVFAYIVEELFEIKSRIDQAKVISFILAGSVGVFGFTVGYLNYRRKSGVSIECVIQETANNGEIEFYFFNLKDRPIVLFEFILITKNVEVYYKLQKPLVLNSYGADAFYARTKEYAFNYLDATNNEDTFCGVISAESRVPESLLPSLQDGKSGVRAKTNRGIVYIEIKSLDNLTFKKEMRLEPVSEVVRNSSILNLPLDNVFKKGTIAQQDVGAYKLELKKCKNQVKYFAVKEIEKTP